MSLLTELYPGVGVGKFCSMFGKTRQAWYYTHNQRLEQKMTDSIVVRLVRELREEQPRLGTRKLYHLLGPLLEAHGIKMGRDKLFDLLDSYGLLIRQRRRRAITTDSDHPYRKYDNLIRELRLVKKNQLWVSDITYIRIGEDFGYLSLITDAYSRKIVGYELLDNLSAQGPIKALETALDQQKPPRHHLIHHSDRGVQYCCSDYTSRLQQHDIGISMSKKGDPYQNAIAERVNGILKSEFGMDQSFESMDQAKQKLKTAVDIYNNRRPHNSLSKLTPASAHELTGMIKRDWKNYPKRRSTQNQDELITS